MKEFLQLASQHQKSVFFMPQVEKKIDWEMLQFLTTFLTDKEKEAACLLISGFMSRLLRYEAENIGKTSEHFKSFSLLFKKISELIFMQFKPANMGSHSMSGIFKRETPGSSPDLTSPKTYKLE